MANNWPTCEQNGCSGVCAGTHTACIAHVTPAVRDAMLEQFSKSGDLDVRGVTVSDSLLKVILDVAPHGGNGCPTFSAVLFNGATFEGDAGFSGATFKSRAKFNSVSFKRAASFVGARFEGDAQFDGATFKGPAYFDRVSFPGEVGFNKATFEGNATFGGASFKGAAFRGATFKSYVWFNGASFKRGSEFWRTTFEGRAQFGGVKFERDIRFTGSTFERDASFERATFKGHVGFTGVTFERDATFEASVFESSVGFTGTSFEGDATFEKAMFKGDVLVLGPTSIRGKLDLDGAQFASTVRIETDASELTCRRGQFRGGVRFEVRGALVRLDDSDFSVPSLFTGPPYSNRIGGKGQLKLLSLQGANVAGLALGNVDLRECHFAGAHNLDKLRLEAGAAFGFSPAVAWWERRQVIAEEAAWRAARNKRGSWTFPQWGFVEDRPGFLNPGAIADLYRALRKGREDAKDEPGAADFYYGEMEMRRHDHGAPDGARPRGLATRSVLFIYWLISGYGLRAWRSLVALAVVTALFAVAFHYVGFIQPPEPVSYWTSLLYAFRSTISLTDSQVTLTAWGAFFQALLRITGPVLLGPGLLTLSSDDAVSRVW